MALTSRAADPLRAGIGVRGGRKGWWGGWGGSRVWSRFSATLWRPRNGSWPRPPYQQHDKLHPLPRASAITSSPGSAAGAAQTGDQQVHANTPVQIFSLLWLEWGGNSFFWAHVENLLQVCWHQRFGWNLKFLSFLKQKVKESELRHASMTWTRNRCTARTVVTVKNAARPANYFSYFIKWTDYYPLCTGKAKELKIQTATQRRQKSCPERTSCFHICGFCLLKQRCCGHI